MRPPLILTWLAVLCIALSGCGKTPPSTFYVLDSANTVELETPPACNLSVGIGPVSIPAYFDRTQLVTRSGKNTITIHEYDRWGDSFKKQVVETLAENLSILLQPSLVVLFPWERALRPTYQLVLTLHHFEGDIGKSINLKATWRIIDVASEKTLLASQYSKKHPIHGNDLSSYVATQSRALADLSHQIALCISSLSK